MLPREAIGAQRFRYDAVSRLVEAKIWVPENNPPLNSFDDGFETGDACNWEVRNPDSGCVAGAHQLGLESYSYDAYGNLVDRTTATSEGATQVNTPADPQTNRLTGAVTYDAEGNMTGWNGAQYDFDALGQMVRMRNGNQDWLFAYSTGGERILQVAEGGLGEKRWTVRDVAGRVLREWVEPPQSAPVWTRDWIYRGSQLLATVEPPQQALLDQGEGETSQVTQSAPLSFQLEVTRHLTLDHLGTPRLVTDEAGTNLAFHIYWPFGREASDPLQNELRKKFTGHERDSYDLSSLADELDYMHARFGNPQTGRFLSVDPLEGGLAGPGSLNRFAYVGGNPLRFIDPEGLCRVPDASANGPFDCGFGGWTTNGLDPTGGSAGPAGGSGGPKKKRENRPHGRKPPGPGGGDHDPDRDPGREHDCNSLIEIGKRLFGELLDSLQSEFGIDAEAAKGLVGGGLGIFKNSDGSVTLKASIATGYGMSGRGLAPSLSSLLAGTPAPTSSGVSLFGRGTVSISTLSKFKSYIPTGALRNLLFAVPGAVSASAHTGLRSDGSLVAEGMRVERNLGYGQSGVAGLELRLQVIPAMGERPCQ